jgi:hypothetical protein
MTQIPPPHNGVRCSHASSRSSLTGLVEAALGTP